MLRGSVHNKRRLIVLLAVATALTAALLMTTLSGRAAGDQPAQAAAAKITYKHARSILLKSVIKPKSLAAGDALIAFRMKSPLKAGTKIHTFRDYGAVIKLRRPAWFFWVDDDPKALFEHSTRFVLVDAASGKVSVFSRSWWPVISGKAPWFAYADYWKPSSWAFSTVTAPPAASTRRVAPLIPPTLRAAASTTECAVIIDGAGDEKAGTVEDAKAMDNALGTVLGYTTKKLTPPNNNKADFEKAVGDLIADGCTDVLLFISSHGSKGSVTMGGGTYTPADMKALIDKYPTVGFKVVVEACHSGSWTEPLKGKTKILITSTDADSLSYSADPDGPDDPNPDDKGTEFVSGLVEDLLLTHTDPTAKQRVQNCVMMGKSLLVCQLEIAFESAVAKDEDAKAGNEKPQKH